MLHHYLQKWRCFTPPPLPPPLKLLNLATRVPWNIVNADVEVGGCNEHGVIDGRDGEGLLRRFGERNVYLDFFYLDEIWGLLLLIFVMNALLLF